MNRNLTTYIWLLIFPLAFALYNLQQIPRESFLELCIWFGVAFTSFYLIWKHSDQKQVPVLLVLACAVRLILVPYPPNLSDDVYRFIWDGRIIAAGLNPFEQLPVYFLEHSTPGLSPELFALLNSPEYFTVYPPVCQFSFLCAVWLSPESISGSILALKSLLLVAEAGSIYLLFRLLNLLNLPLKNALLYALNPLVIIEIVGNLHYEGLMVFFFLLAIFLWYKYDEKKSGLYFVLSAAAFALSIATKLLPLMFLPFLIRRLGWIRSFVYFTIIGSILVVLFFPFISSTLVQNFGDSLDLYFRKFEFNASIYYLLRWIGFQLTGFNMISVIGPFLAISVVSTIMYRVYTEQFDSKLHIVIGGYLFQALIALTCYLFLAMTVHPWYTILPLALSCFTKFRFTVVWTALVFFTYINYSYPLYFENLWVVTVEYGIIFGLFYKEYTTKSLLSI